MLPGILADDNNALSDALSVVFACLLLAVMLLVWAYAVMWLRRRYWGADDGAVPSTGFTLADLRDLHRSGQISEEEFNRAKEKIVAAHQRALQRDAAAAKPNVNKSPPQGL